MSITEAINLCIRVASFVMTAMMLIMATSSGTLKEKVFRWFYVILVLNFTLVLSESLIEFLAVHRAPAMNIVIHILDTLSYEIGLLQGIAFALYLYELFSTKIFISKKPIKCVILLYVVAALFVAIAQANQLFGYFDKSNQYIASDTYWVYAAVVLPPTFMLLWMLLRNAKALARKEFVSLLLYFLLPTMLYALTMRYSDIWFSEMASPIVIFIIYRNIQMDLKQQLIAQQVELTENRIAIMLSQIQPHFLYNSLASIQYLCEVDGAERASSAVQDFSVFLRGNMDSLTHKSLVPFQREMQHTNLYLSLEKRRFGDRIQTRYDTPVMDFFLPALSLQPIVENAVRHGLAKLDKGGIITVRSYENEAFWCVAVADDGVGFNTEEKVKDDRSHVGIENVRSRLKAMCGGILEVTSTPGTGTTATISIPKAGGARL